MTDIALSNAEKKRDELRTRMNESSARIQELVTSLEADAHALEGVMNFIKLWHEMAGIAPPADTQPTAVPDTPLAKAPKPKKPKNSDKTEVALAAAELIKEAGRPLGRSMLFDKLIAKGFTIEGKDPQMVLSTMLWRMPNIVTRLDGFGYWPTGIPFEPARYFVDDQPSLGMS